MRSKVIFCIAKMEVMMADDGSVEGIGTKGRPNKSTASSKTGSCGHHRDQFINSTKYIMTHEERKKGH